MSMINATTPYRRDRNHGIRVPIVMPLVEVTVSPDGHLDVLLDGEPYSAERTLTRDDLKRVVTEIAADLRTAVRVEVHESDAATFTDIVAPESPAPRIDQPRLEVVASPSEVAGSGFLPHEDVAVAVIVARQSAGADGTTHVRLPPALVESRRYLMVLVGQTSGTTLVGGGLS